MNTYGKIFRITTFGESHGKGIGVVIDGCPAGLKLDLKFIQNELNRRRPAQSKITTQRNELDTILIISGIFEDKTTGMPLMIWVKNTDVRSKDYMHIKDLFRPSHADFTYQMKYGLHDYRGGGRSSARETLARVAAGAIAKLILKKKNIAIFGYVSQVGEIILNRSYQELCLQEAESSIVRCPDRKIASQMINLIQDVQKKGDTIGGTISCVIKGVPVGLGEPVFDKLHAELGKAILSINAAKGFEYGSGFSGASMRGSEHNDSFYMSETGDIRTSTNYSGGIQGGISNGENIYFRVAFKPVATIMGSQKSVDKKSHPVVFSGKGRHDPCVVPRAVVVVEAMAALVILDFLIRNQKRLTL